jgi:hypothetical protein
MVKLTRRKLYYYVKKIPYKSWGEIVRKASKYFNESEVVIDHMMMSLDFDNEYGDK